ncbi:MAG: hypothetical protein FWB86_11310 [Treponema sp.]|nr:hypothetical protein [Treponema sp.]MCL2273077.1 hypothetical protein [Treponema sp.]
MSKSINNANKNEFKEKESPEKMIRSLQGIFCKGRYSSWVFTKDQRKTDEKKKKKKHNKGQ